MYGSHPYEDRDAMKLNIFPSKSSHGLRASFCFGTIEGTMLFAMSRREVELLRKEQPKDDDDSDYDWDLNDELPEPDDPGLRLGTSQVKHESSSSAVKAEPSSSAGSKRPALGDTIHDPYGVLAARAKRQRTAAPRPLWHSR